MKFILLTAALLVSVSASADFEPWLKGPCAADFKKFCNDSPPGEESVLDCFKAHQKELSAACQLKRNERVQARKNISPPPRPGNSDGLVPGDEPPPGAPPIVAAKADCAADVEKFCKPGKDGKPEGVTSPPKEGVPPKDGVPPPPPGHGIMGGSGSGPRGCLRDHMKELSPACRAHFERGNSMREEMRKKLHDRKLGKPPAEKVETE